MDLILRFPNFAVLNEKKIFIIPGVKFKLIDNILLSKLLNFNQSIRKLTLSGNNLGVIGCEIFSRVLRTTKIGKQKQNIVFFGRLQQRPYKRQKFLPTDSNKNYL